MNDMVIEVSGLQKRYGNTWGLRDASFVVHSGELVTLVGPNGAGKTTTVRILATFLKPSGGSARVLGMDIRTEYREIRKRISYLPQGYYVGQDLTPMEAVMWNLVARGWPIGEAKLQAKKWLESMGIWELRDRTCWTLSGGEGRRVSVAMALSPEAELVFLDEPTVGLDVEIKHNVWKAIRDFISGGGTILLTTHDMSEAQMISDKVVMISDGNIIVESEPKKLIDSHPYRYRISIAKSAMRNMRDPVQFIDLGDRVIIYARDRTEAINLVDELSEFSSVYSISEVGLEDAYLHLIRKGGKS